MFDNFTSFTIPIAPDVSISGVTAGSGPPLLLLHGFPQTHHIWHIIAPQLTSHYTVIAPDLRGYGASSTPPSSAPHIPYSKAVLADDMHALMAALGHPRYFVCAHDRGARVAHFLLVTHPEAVLRAILLDICPTASMWQATDAEFARAYWHWFFLTQPAPVPETLITKAPAEFAAAFLRGGYSGKVAFAPAAYAEYERQLADRETVHAMCEDYRASATVDVDDAREYAAAGRKIKCPIRVYWGQHGIVGKLFDALKEWRAVSEAEVEGEALDCGHYIPEEMPDAVLMRINEFLV